MGGGYLHVMVLVMVTRVGVELSKASLGYGVLVIAILLYISVTKMRNSPLAIT